MRPRQESHRSHSASRVCSIRESQVVEAQGKHMRDLRWESKMDKEFGGSKTYRELQEGPKTTVKPAPDPKKEEYFPFPTDFKPDPELPIEVRDPAPSPVVGPVEHGQAMNNPRRTRRSGTMGGAITTGSRWIGAE